MEISDEDKERMEEIRTLPNEFAVEAFKWWHKHADKALKNVIIVMAYYEMLAQSSEYADKALEDWSNDEN